LENEHEHAHGDGSYEIPPPAEAMKAVTAFLVVTKADGTHTAFADVNTPLELERAATINDMYVGAAQVMRDVEIMQITQNVVQNVINAQMQMAQQAMAAQQDVQLANKIMMPNRTQRRH
jgi:hypothetical protein